MLTVRTTVPNPDEQQVLNAQRDRVVQELESYGFLAEAPLARSSGATLCRLPGGPSLLVCDDGRLELLSRQPGTHAVMHSQSAAKPIRWGRTLLFLALLCATALLGLLLVAMIVG